MTLRVTTKNGQRIVVTDDPVGYERYIERITTRYGNHVYRDGKLIPREELAKESEKEKM